MKISSFEWNKNLNKNIQCLNGINFNCRIEKIWQRRISDEFIPIKLVSSASIRNLFLHSVPRRIHLEYRHHFVVGSVEECGDGVVKIVCDIWLERNQFDTVRFATLQTVKKTFIFQRKWFEISNFWICLFVWRQYGDTTHTFVEQGDYKGFFLPGYLKSMSKDTLLPTL